MRPQDILVLIFGLFILYLVYQGLPAAIDGGRQIAQFNGCNWGSNDVEIVCSKCWPTISERYPTFIVYATRESCNIYHRGRPLAETMFEYYDIENCEVSMHKYYKKGVLPSIYELIDRGMSEEDKELLKSFGCEYCTNCIDNWVGHWERDLPGFRCRADDWKRITEEPFKYSTCIGDFRIRYRLHGRTEFTDVRIHGTPLLYSRNPQIPHLVACKFNSSELINSFNNKTGLHQNEVQIYYPSTVKINFAREPPVTTTTTTIPPEPEPQPEPTIWDKIIEKVTSFVDSILSFFKSIFL